MNQLMLLALLAGIPGADPDTKKLDAHWNWNNVGILMTSANIFKVNQAQPVFDKKLLMYFDDAKLGVHKRRTAEKSVDLVFDKKYLSDSKLKEFSEVELGESQRVMDTDTMLMKSLTALGLNLPVNATVKTELDLAKLKMVAASDTAEMVTTYIYGHSFLDLKKSIPFSDSIVHIGVANKMKLDKEIVKLTKSAPAKKPADGAKAEKVLGPADGKAIYESIFDKVTLTARTVNSAAVDGLKANMAAGEQGMVEPLYLLKPRGEAGDAMPKKKPAMADAKEKKDGKAEDKVMAMSHGGLLLYYTAIEEPRQLVGIATRAFTINGGMATAQVQAKCLLDQVIAPHITDKVNLSLPKMQKEADESNAMKSGFHTIDGDWYVTISVPTEALPELKDAKKGASKDDPKVANPAANAGNFFTGDPSAFMLDWDSNRRGDSFSTVIARAPEAPEDVDSINDKTLLRLFDEQCSEVFPKPVSLAELATTAAKLAEEKKAAPKVETPAPVPPPNPVTPPPAESPDKKAPPVTEPPANSSVR